MDDTNPMNDATKPSICIKCTDFFAISKTGWRYKRLETNVAFHFFEENRTVNDLLESARLYCPICRTAVKSMSLDQVELLHKKAYVLFEAEFISTKPMFGHLKVDGKIFQLIEVDEVPEWVANPSMSTHTGSNLSWSFLEKSFQDCNKFHKTCLQGSVSPKLPARLIDVGSNPSQQIRLVLSNEISVERNPPPYIALTHSWRNNNILRLLTYNLEEFKKRIPWEDISQTFKDAIKVAQRLGIQYLWIDSLCIVQNDPEDWRIQSVTMQDVYSNCILNLAATAAGSGGDGLYVEKDPFLAIPLAISITWEGTQVILNCIRGQVQYDCCMKTDLNRRGWVFQERLLSPRTIHFSSQLFWECKELFAWETYPVGPPWQYHLRDDTLDSTVRPSSFLKKDWPDRIRKHPNSPHFIWREFVEEFSCCKLTKEEDKLVAIAGLAKAFQPLSESRYICGLWQSRIFEDLVWYIEGIKQADGNDAFRPVKYRAPSWSWASIEGRVIFHLLHPPIQPLVQVLKTEVVSLGDDQFGQVARASMVVSGNPRPFPKISSDRISNLVNPDLRSVDPRIFLDTREEILVDSLVLPLCNGGNYRRPFMGLLLRPTETPGHYRRIGFLRQWQFATHVPTLEWDFENSDWVTENETASNTPTILELL